MIQHIVRRLLISIPLLVGVTIGTFAMAELLPGDYVNTIVPPEVAMQREITEEEMKAARAYYGLDKPAYQRYLIWLCELVLRGNLGTSFANGEPIAKKLPAYAWNTVQLTGSALFLAVLIGTTIGVFQALYPYSLFDSLANLLTFLWLSIPSFVFAITAIYIFAFKIPLFPIGGVGPPRRDVGLLTHLHYMVLPVAMLTFGALPNYIRFSRNAMLDVIRADYVTAARAKGLLERIVVVRHALRNALLPLITITAINMPSVLGSATIAETVFFRPGMGAWMLDAVKSRDYPVIVVITLLTSTVVLLSNLVADIAYAVVDPRIRYH